ncbi:iron ABC transporter permease [Shewanella sp. C32]|uniref:Iron ABC transporter permease n=1 Tax=Shewanella electrica TaxID=515560 RepID=A0ABT2FPI7_9GAMM|nr:iron ABC transporter permease [Shewanella electrica]MCH1925577.1 iron ABC transporter permease [Shewanella electrica]MCS4557116.1 iron ABC transporter permease [Shewanella electrica]
MMRRDNQARTVLWRSVGWSGLLLLLLVTPLLASSFGAAQIGVFDVAQLLWHHLVDAEQSSSINARIIWELRLPRVLLAFTAGAGLALSGFVLQSVTRNPLADPYLFGISSGASFGAVLVVTLAGTSVVAGLSLPTGAFLGACLSVLLVLSLSGQRVTTQVERMLLSGVAVSFMFGALTSLLLYFSSPLAAQSLLFWTMGSFAQAKWAELWLPMGIVAIALALVIGQKRQLLAMQGGDETAHTLGVRVVKLRLLMLLLCSLITATLVAHCGGIGFVGLMVPHVVRLLVPQRQSIMLTALVGGLFMVWVDVLARSALPTQELPVGVITSALGSVFFLFVLRKRGQ